MIESATTHPDTPSVPTLALVNFWLLVLFSVNGITDGITNNYVNHTVTKLIGDPIRCDTLSLR